MSTSYSTAKHDTPLRLSLTTTSLSNTVISDPSDALFFEVVTPKWTPHHTKVSRRDPNSHELEVVAELEREGKTANVRLRGEQFKPVGQWLKRDKASKAKITGKWRGKDGKTYEWLVKKGMLQLIRTDQPDNAIATFHRERRWFAIFLMSRHPYLEVQRGCMETIDSLVVSFLIMEHNRRYRIQMENQALM